ncbi:unnamed protein product, partial [Brassica rapa subsp. narinosa]
VFVRKQCCNVKSKRTLGNGCLSSRIDEERSKMRYLAKYGQETDSEKVPRGKDEKDFQKIVKECLKLLRGKRMGAGDSSRSDAERSNTVCRSIRAMERHRLSTRLTACLGICVLRASACGFPIRPVLKHGRRSLTCVRVNGIAGAWKRVLSGRGGCFVEPSHGIESSMWAIFGKQNWRCGMNRKPGYGS